MPRILHVQTDEQGAPVVIMAVAPHELGMTAVRVDDGPHVQLQRAAEYPPPPGHWFRHATGGPIYVGCPKCGKEVTVACPPHQVHPDGRLEPLWVCPFNCGLEDVVQLADFALHVDGACPTCAHAAHGAGCVVERGGEPCRCMDDGDEHRPVYKLERSVKGRIVLPSEMQAEARRIVDETMAKARHGQARH